TINGGYLNFMGNEFGHPEWIDFPREGNGWSYKYARRQWDLVDREDLKYKFLNAFDNAMVETVSSQYNFQSLPVEKLWEKDDDQILAFRRGDLVFVFNWSPNRSFADYGFLAPAGEYEVVLDSDRHEFGGYDNIDDKVHHFTTPDPLYSPSGKGWLKLYIPARTAMVLRFVKPAPKKAASKAKAAEPKKEAKKTTTRKTAVKKVAEEKEVAPKKTTTRKTTAKKETVKKEPAAKKTTAKKEAAPKKTTTRKTTAKKADKEAE
ncbi:MAG: alpha amylase C-terminal domain-containing protein, partial [Muribaculaceae bacterium]|nr:alpha amylase C-terminal domain-containing protein [Muribaculaceae bacterium]